MVDMDNVDLAALTAIKATRALEDPVILYEGAEDWAPARDNRIWDWVTFARLHQQMETPVDEPITHATWPEVALWCSTASADAAMVGRWLEGTYRMAFRQCLHEWTSQDPDDAPEPLCEPADLNDHERQKVDALRRAMKRDRDKHYLTTHHSGGPAEEVPKAFWKDAPQSGEVVNDHFDETVGTPVDVENQLSFGDVPSSDDDDEPDIAPGIKNRLTDFTDR